MIRPRKSVVPSLGTQARLNPVAHAKKPRADGYQVSAGHTVGEAGPRLDQGWPGGRVSGLLAQRSRGWQSCMERGFPALPRHGPNRSLAFVALPPVTITQQQRQQGVNTWRWLYSTKTWLRNQAMSWIWSASCSLLTTVLSGFMWHCAFLGCLIARDRVGRTWIVFFQRPSCELWSRGLLSCGWALWPRGPWSAVLTSWCCCETGGRGRGGVHRWLPSWPGASEVTALSLGHRPSETGLDGSRW